MHLIDLRLNFKEKATEFLKIQSVRKELMLLAQ